MAATAMQTLPPDSTQPTPLSKSASSSTLVEDDPETHKSYGVQKAEAAARIMTRTYVYVIFALIALAAYVVSLDQYTSSTYELEALATSFGQHSLIATINTAQSIMQSVSQPPFAKLCDIVGRFESYCLAVVLYVVGYAIVAGSPSIGVYAFGTVVYTIGITGFWLINQVIIADNTSTRSRLFWSIFPSIPGTINVWVSGNIASGLISTASWRWGFGMFTILVPALLSPVILALAHAQRRARKLGYLDAVSPPWRHGRATKLARDISWQVDLVGLFLMVAAFTLILVPITIARTATDGWQSAFVPGMMVPGGACLAAFIYYEVKIARFPILPVYLLSNRTIIAAFGIALFSPMAGSIQGNYLLTWYRVAAGQSITSATRLNGLTSFAGTLTAAVTGLLVTRIRRLRPFIIVGACIVVLVLGLMTRFRGRQNGPGELAALQVFKGIGQGMISFPTQAALQAASKHEHLALLTASWLATFYISQAIGSAIGGAVWSATLPPRLLVATGGNQTLASSIYSNPIAFIGVTGFDDPVRENVAQAYSDAQRFILITAVSVASIVVLLTLLLGDPKLGDTVTLEAVEGEDRVVKPSAGVVPIDRHHQDTKDVA